MKIGFVGLGKMGGNMVLRLLRDGHEVVAFDPQEEARRWAQENGARSVKSIPELAKNLDPIRTVRIMVPAGKTTESVISKLSQLLAKGDIIIDGGNSFYQDSRRRAASLEEKGISLLDAGTSGGIRGLTDGYCLMVGGEREVFKHAEPVFRTLAPADGYADVGPSGAGHFVKMVHNGIEYALLQA